MKNLSNAKDNLSTFTLCNPVSRDQLFFFTKTYTKIIIEGKGESQLKFNNWFGRIF